MQSKEWMEKYPVEFNSILNMIENEKRSDGSDFMDDSTPSFHHGGGYADDSMPSVAYGGGYADDSTPSFHHGGCIYASDETPSILRHQDDPMGSDEVDSSPNGNEDDDENDSYMPLQRTMSSLPPQIRK